MSREEPHGQAASHQTRESALAGGVVLLGMGLVILARVVRPLPSGAHPTLALLVGSLPNFGAGLGLPFAAWMAYAVLRRRSIRVSRLSFCSVCLGVLGALIGWEYTSWAVWGIPIDMKDLLATGAGVGLAALLHAIAEGGPSRGVSAGHRSDQGRPTRARTR